MWTVCRSGTIKWRESHASHGAERCWCQSLREVRARPAEQGEHADAGVPPLSTIAGVVRLELRGGCGERVPRPTGGGFVRRDGGLDVGNVGQ